MADDEIQEQVREIVYATHTAVLNVMHTDGLPDLTWVLDRTRDDFHDLREFLTAVVFQGMGTPAEAQQWAAHYELTEVESLWPGQREWEGLVKSRKVRVWAITDAKARSAAVQKWIDDLNAQFLLRKETGR